MISKYLRSHLIFVLFLSLVFADEDGKNTVEGTVSSKEKGLPLQGANVELVGNGNKQYGATTDADGGFVIDDVGDGTSGGFPVGAPLPTCGAAFVVRIKFGATTGVLKANFFTPIKTV